MHYNISSTVDGDVIETVSPAKIQDRVSELSGRGTLADGRPFASYILSQIGKRDRNGRPRRRVYVATDPGSDGRAIHGRGFIVERVA